MKFLKQIAFLALILIFVWACGTPPIKSKEAKKEEPVVIANDSLEYEIIIIDPGFNLYLNSIALPKGYYSQNYLENRNRIFVNEWNMRARNSSQYNTTIYENIINYESNIDYGYEVNYLLFNYFMFAQRKYKINLAFGYSGRIR